MKPQRGRVVVIVGAVVALCVILGSGFFVARNAGWIPDRLGLRRALLPLPTAPRGGRVDIGSGEIDLSEFLSFLGDATGLPVIYDSTDLRITQARIQIAATVRDGDVELVRSILEANGFVVEVETLASGKDVIRVRVKAGRR